AQLNLVGFTLKRATSSLVEYPPVPQLPVFLFRIISHSAALGMEYQEYDRALVSLPTTITTSPRVTLVAALAPVRHTSPKATSPPNTLRPRIDGRLYSMDISDVENDCVMVAVGLSAGSFRPCAKDVVATPANNTNASVMYFIK